VKCDDYSLAEYMGGLLRSMRCAVYFQIKSTGVLKYGEHLELEKTAQLASSEGRFSKRKRPKIWRCSARVYRKSLDK